MSGAAGMTGMTGWLFSIGGGLLGLLFTVFAIWMLVDAVRRGEMLWALFIFLFPPLNAPLYFLLVYRGAGDALSGGFQLPGSHDRRRIKQLQDQIHHLDKAHHHLELGDIYFQQGKFKKAEVCYRASLERDAEDIDARAHYGQCLLRLNRAAEALPYLESVRAQDARHDYGYSLMALAECYALLGQRDKALPAWQEVLQSHSYARARVQFASLLMESGRKEEAARALQEVVADDVHAPAFQRRRERPWVRKARQLLKQC